MNYAPEIIERSHTDRGDIQLQKRENHFEIIYNGTFLMATYNGESERLLVSSALRKCPYPRKVLIGGLGVGFSLEEALSDSRVEQVDVVEIEEAIIRWNRKHLAPYSGHALDDPRTNVIHTDLVKWMNETDASYDAVCLDIDNDRIDRVGVKYGALFGARHKSGHPAASSAWRRILLERRVVAGIRGIFETVFPWRRSTADSPAAGEPDYVYLASSPKSIH